MRWNGKKVLITGSMGIIGRALVSRLVSESAQLLSVDIKPTNWSDNSIKHVQADLSKVIPDECASFWA